MQLNETQPVARALDKSTFNPQIDELGLDRRGIAEIERVRPNPLVTTIESIATGNPDRVIRQSDAAKVVAKMANLAKHSERIEKIYQNTRIDTRHLALDLLSDEAIAFSRAATMQARMQLYREHAIPLAEKVARKALKSCGWQAPRRTPVCPPIRSKQPSDRSSLSPVLAFSHQESIRQLSNGWG